MDAINIEDFKIHSRRARRADRLRLLKMLTPARAVNLAKLLVSYHLSKRLKRPIYKGFPFSVSVEPTTSCNLRCPECPSGLRSFTRETGMLDMAFYQRAIDQISRRTLFLTLYFQGEPYLHRQFTDLVKYAADRNMYVATSTNGHYLTDKTCEATVRSGLARMVVSIDGATQESYAAYRIGGRLDKVLEGVRRLSAWKKKLNSATPHIIFQFIVFRQNEHELDDIQRLAAEVGVDELKLKTAQIYDYEHGSALIPKNEEFSRYSRNPDGTYRFKNQLLDQCWRMWQGCVITWDGHVVPCCFDKDADHKLGSLQNSTLKEIVHGPLYRQFRGKLLRGRREIDICTNCTEGTKVFAEQD